MNKMLWAMIASVAALGTMLFMLGRQDRTPNPSNDGDTPSGQVTSLMLFCAASNRAVMEEVVQEYQAETGRTVEVQYGASQTLLAQMEASGTGDLYLPADDSYLQFATEKELVAEILPIASMQPVIAVRNGNPKSITGLKDLLNEEVRLVQANPDAAAIGKVTKSLLQASGQWNEIDSATTAYRTTVTEAANDVLVGAADAAIVYDAVLHTYPDLEYVALPELAEGTSQISVGVISSTRKPSVALHFARYVSAR